MIKYKYIDIALNVIGGLLILWVGLQFLLFRIFPESYHQGFIICPTIDGPIPNYIAGILIVVCSVFIFTGYWPSIVFGFIGALFFFTMDFYWYLKTMNIDRFLPGIIGGFVGTAYFLCKLYLRRKLKKQSNGS